MSVINSLGPYTYPIFTMYYVLVHANTTRNCEVAFRLADMLLWYDNFRLLLMFY